MTICDRCENPASAAQIVELVGNLACLAPDPENGGAICAICLDVTLLQLTKISQHDIDAMHTAINHLYTALDEGIIQKDHCAHLMDRTAKFFMGGWMGL